MLQRRSLLHTIFFLLGFSLIFVAIGFSTSFFGSFFQQYQDLIRQIGAILIILFGLVIVGVFQPEFLMKDKRVEFKNRPSGYFGSLIVGLAFAAGWTPCTGPILGSVISLGMSNPTSAISYMVGVYLRFCNPIFNPFIFHWKIRMD